MSFLCNYTVEVKGDGKEKEEKRCSFLGRKRTEFP